MSTLFSRSSQALTLAAILAAVCLPAQAEARDRYGRYPAVRVAPGLADEWLLQLMPGSGVVPGYTRPDLDALPAPGGLVLDKRPAALDRRPHQPMQRVYVRTPSGRVIEARPYDGRSGMLSSDPQAVGSIAMTSRSAQRREVGAAYLPQIVDYRTTEAPGTIVIDTDARFLYKVLEGGRAKRYGVGVGKPGFEWAGTHRVTQKREWPTWTPPSQMRQRERDKGRILPAAMEGGVDNPLGARAMYLGSTLYRIHGTNQPWTIGHAVSSGCIRMRNEDVMDLYDGVAVGTRVVVL